VTASATTGEVTSTGDSVAAAASAFASALPSAAGGVGLDGGLRSAY
jgi:hypothetical protein